MAARATGSGRGGGGAVNGDGIGVEVGVGVEIGAGDSRLSFTMGLGILYALQSHTSSTMRRQKIP